MPSDRDNASPPRTQPSMQPSVQPSMQPSMQPSFHGHVHAFRAFAIVNILAVHAGGIWLYVLRQGGPPSPALELTGRFNEWLFHASTIYFALISGLLYSRVLHTRGRRQFFAGKAAHVLAPYAVMTLIFSTLDWSPNAGWIWAAASLGEWTKGLLFNAISGQALFVLWYIPIIFALFLLTPWLHARLPGLVLAQRGAVIRAKDGLWPACAGGAAAL